MLFEMSPIVANFVHGLHSFNVSHRRVFLPASPALFPFHMPVLALKYLDDLRAPCVPELEDQSGAANGRASLLIKWAPSVKSLTCRHQRRLQ